ncbi:hypothetical protein F8388_022512 [Cannabis sativa]|uniref:HAT C-terminal dimerisation domain-containing protein n=1 Tax=Cannabis sativa TaxID=3483 RepID=A0A7J6EK89_CANSA|nr:hypothetical protein F8388_022512 [Cannabis sativa]
MFLQATVTGGGLEIFTDVKCHVVLGAGVVITAFSMSGHQSLQVRCLYYSFSSHAYVLQLKHGWLVRPRNMHSCIEILTHASGLLRASGMIHVSGLLHASGLMHVSGLMHASGVLHASGHVHAKGLLHVSGLLHARGLLHATKTTKIKQLKEKVKVEIEELKKNLLAKKEKAGKDLASHEEDTQRSIRTFEKMRERKRPGKLRSSSRSWMLRKMKVQLKSRMLHLIVPVTIVASEVVFSTGWYILDPFKSSLISTIVEALLCLKN